MRDARKPAIVTRRTWGVDRRSLIPISGETSERRGCPTQEARGGDPRTQRKIIESFRQRLNYSYSLRQGFPAPLWLYVQL